MAALVQEALQVADIDVLIIPVINGLKRLLECEVIGIFYNPFHLVCLQLEPDFFIKQLAQRPFDMAWQKLTPWHFVVGSLGSSCAQKRIVAGQQDLKKVMIAELFAVAEVEVLDQRAEVFRL